MSTDAQPAFSMGDIISQSLGIMKQNFVPFSALAILLSGIPQWIIQVVFIGDVHKGTFSPESFMTWAFAADYLTTLLLSFILYSALVYGTMQALKGAPVSIGQNVGRALQVLVPVVLLSIIMSVGITIGFILLIIPGVILSLMWAVAIPVRVVEQKSVFNTLSRSADLTKGERWRMLGLFVIFMLIAVAISIILGLVVGLVSATSFLLGTLLSAIITSILGAFGAVLLTVLYAKLRQAKDGVDAAAMAEVL